MLRAVILYSFVAGSLFAQLKIDWISQLAGNDTDSIRALAIDSAGNVIVGGLTHSRDLATPGAFLARRPSSNLFRLTGSTLVTIEPTTGQPLFDIAASGSTWYASAQDGLWRTLDGGKSWEPLPAPAATPVNAIAISPVSTQRLYATSANVLYLSLDGGLSWNKLHEFAPSDRDTHIPELVIDPRKPERMYASVFGRYPGAYQSLDAGVTWRRLPIHLWSFSLDPLREGVVFGLDFRASFVSRDAGTTWQELLIDERGIRSLVADARVPGRLFAGTNSTFSRSEDDGKTWQEIKLDLPRQVTTIVATPDGSVHASANELVLSSTDGFKTYSQKAAGTHIRTLEVADNNSVLIVPGGSATDAFVAKYNPLGELLSATYLGGTANDQINSIAVDPSGEIYVGGRSESMDLPFTAEFRSSANFFDRIYPFAAKLSSDGQRLIYFVRISARSEISDVAVDSSGSLYAAGTNISGGHPTTPGVVQPDFRGRYCGFFGCVPLTKTDARNEAANPKFPGPPPPTNAFLTKLSADGKSIVWSTYLGEQHDSATSIGLAADRSIILGGSKTWKLNSAASELQWTFDQQRVQDLTLDAEGNILAVGTLNPHYTLALAGELSYKSPLDSFVLKLSATGSPVFLKTLGGEQADTARAATVAADGTATIVGSTNSQSFPMVAPFQAAFSKNTSFLTQLKSDGNALLYSTYIGDQRPFSAVAVAQSTESGAVVFAGNTSYSGGGEIDGFIVKMSSSQPPALSLNAVENLASGEGGPITPGEFVVVRGTGFAEDARLLIDGRELPAVSRSTGQMIVRLADDLPIEGTREFIIESGGLRTNTLLVRSSHSAPAIFTQDRSGRGQGLIFNEDGTLNTPDNPAAKGSVISIVANGVGPLKRVGGSVVTDKPVNVFIGGWFANGVDARLLPVPGVGESVYVIKMFVPDPKPPHAPQYQLPALVAVNLRIDDQFSQSGVSLSVK